MAAAGAGAAAPTMNAVLTFYKAQKDAPIQRFVVLDSVTEKTPPGQFSSSTFFVKTDRDVFFFNKENYIAITQTKEIADKTLNASVTVEFTPGGPDPLQLRLATQVARRVQQKLIESDIFSAPYILFQNKHGEFIYIIKTEKVEHVRITFPSAEK